MRALFIVLACSFGSVAHAAPHLTVGTLKLDPQFSRPAPSPPPSRKPQVKPPPPVQAARQPRFYIGETWRMGHGRALSLHLTPDTDHCAPLMQLTF